MLNVITTTKTIQNRDGDEFIITRWAVGGYTLVRTECPALDRNEWRVHSSRDLPSITDMSSFDVEVPEFGVNWSACGTKRSPNARAYGSLVMTAADVADVFNRIAANE